MGAMGEWNDPAVARAAIKALAASWDGAITDECALSQGLVHPDRGVRYAAAMACLSVDPDAAFLNSDMVVGIVANAVAEGSVRQVLVVEPNAEARTAMIHHMNEAGLYAVGAESGARGLIKAKAFSVFDVILVRSALSDITAFQVVKELKDDFRTRDIPVVLMSNNMDSDRAHFNGKVAGFMADSTNPEIYVNEVKGAAGSSLNDDRKAALAVSLAAARALAHANGRTDVFDYSGAIDALADAVGEKPDNIRLAACHALARFGDESAVERLLAVFSNSANSAAVRAGAASALGGCLDGAAPSEGVFNALVAAMGDGDVAVRTASGIALGNMDLTDEQSAKALTANRID